MDLKISVIGTGYLGATHAACLAELGFEVIGVDNVPAKVACLNSGIAPFADPGLDDLLGAHVASGRLRFTTEIREAAEVADVHLVALADILGDDTRIGRRFLDAGIGFGGGCLPKDIRALSARAEELGAESVTGLLREVDEINLLARGRVAELAHELSGNDLAGRRVAVLGAAFKPLSDDVRDSPALDVARRVHRRGADVRVFDPEASLNARSVAPELTYVASLESALRDADLVLHLTEWPEFAAMDPHWAARLVRRPVIIDGRNKLDVERWMSAGWTVHAVGRSRRTVPVPTAPVDAAASA